MGNAPPPEDLPTPINLMRGWPNPSLLPTALIASAAATTLSDPTTAHAALLYGPDPGYEPCRKAIAHWLTTFYQPPSPVSASRLCITGGASQNLGCLLATYTDPTYTRNIWIVAPAYMLAFRIFEQDANFAGKLRGVPEDEQGVDLEFLRREIRKSEERAQDDGVDRPLLKAERAWAKVYKHVIYCVPTFANPSSRTMSLRRREGLVRLAREFDALVVADDVYDFLQWPAQVAGEVQGKGLGVLQEAHLPRLVDVDRGLEGGAERVGADGFGNACSNGSFSKIAGPGMRTGWVEGTARFAYGVSQTGTTASGGAPSQLTSTYLTHLLTTHALQTHITSTLLPAYTTRYASLLTAIQTHLLPLNFRLPQPHREIVGGYFVWLELPTPLTATALARRCQEDEDVVIAPGTIFEVPGDEKVGGGFEGHVRLCFAWEEEGLLGEGVRRVSRVAGKMLEEVNDGRTFVGGKVDLGAFK